MFSGERLCAFARDFFAGVPPAGRVPRGAVVFVGRDTLICAVGFGVTAAGDSVDPHRTIFRAASNSKLIVATAAMQLATAGRWQLSDDVNRYLPAAARLESNFDQPIRIANLLTHTSGLEDRLAGSVTIPSSRISLADYFARNRFRRIAAPGVEISYSNIGMALAGYLVELRSGEPFGRYAERHIFAPLGMTRSTFDQPSPAAWRKELAGGLPRRRFDVVFNPYPAASLQATPVDMGRFLAALLGNGGNGKRRILESFGVVEMLAPHWRPQPNVPAATYGFFEGEERGHRTLFHTGDSGDHSLVLLLPNDNVGLYLVFSGSDEQTSFRERFARRFLDTFLTAVAAPTEARDSTPASVFHGRYRTAQLSHSNFEKVKGLLAQLTVDAEGEGLVVHPPGGERPVRLRRVGPLTFRGDSSEIVTFRRDNEGVTGFTLTGFVWDPSSWDRVGLLESGPFQLSAFGAALLVLIGRAIIAPLFGLIRRSRSNVLMESRLDRCWWRLSAIASWLVLLAPVAAFATAFLSFQHPVIAVPRAVRVLSVLLWGGVICGLTLAPAITWRTESVSMTRRAMMSAVWAALVVIGVLAAYFRVVP